MNNPYFHNQDSLFDITEKYPETIELFASIGFEQMQDETKRAAFGKAITLQMALQMKKINVETFSEGLIEVIEDRRNNIDGTVREKTKKESGDIRIQGILPCPVRIPLLEAFTKWMEENNRTDLDYNLQAASMGIDWLKDSLLESENAEFLADIFISAGFDLFFDSNLMGKFKKQGVFQDMTGFERLNADFDNETIDLRDPDKQYSMIGVVPAVFLVNTDELNGRDMPRSWKDLLQPEFENSVSLPIGDFDLFNAILLNIHKQYGEDGVRKLGKALLRSMHPSEMVKSHMKKAEKPVVTIMPYFFTKMTKRGGPMTAVWPVDGAIISPIFLLTKKDKQEKIQPIVDFFASKEVGEILAHNGKFPSVNPDVDNMIAKDHSYMWLGWEYIQEQDIAKLIQHCEDLFQESVQEVKV